MTVYLQLWILIWEQGNEESVTVCAISPRSGYGNGQIGPLWRYGEEPPGFFAEGCDPLRPNVIYGMAAQRSIFSFKLTEEGGVETVEPSCPREFRDK
jgi:hypothetical protein